MYIESPTIPIGIPTDDDLSDLESQLRIRLNGRIRQLRLIWRDNGLVLRGQSQTYYAKQLAQVELMNNFHISIRANEIDVDQAMIKE